MQQHLAALVEDTQIHRAGVQVEAAVVAMLLGVESHGGSPPVVNDWPRH